jgi:TRAP-type C4-dicarboxylate transport system permease large subunit
MEKNGYTRKFAAAITAASSVIGPIIPPSGIMIIYAYVMGESVAALFLAGIVPGIMVGVGLMVMVRLLADRYDLPKAERIVQKNQTITPLESWVSFVLVRINIAGLLYALSGIVTQFIPTPVNNWLVFALALPIAHAIVQAVKSRVSADFRIVCKKAIAPLQTPIIILGGILVGVFTPTEASAVAVAYALIVSFFVLRSMNGRDLLDVLSKSAVDRCRFAACRRCGVVQDRRVTVLCPADPIRIHPVTIRKSADPLIPDQHTAFRRRHVP